MENKYKSNYNKMKNNIKELQQVFIYKYIQLFKIYENILKILFYLIIVNIGVTHI